MANIWIHVTMVALCLALTVTSQQNPACQDEHRECLRWANRGQCYHNAGFMFIHCPRTCGQCDVTDDRCKNSNRMCVGWAKAGECRRNKPYMEKVCARACAFCTPANDHSVPHVHSHVVAKFWNNWSKGLTNLNLV